MQLPYGCLQHRDLLLIAVDLFADGNNDGQWRLFLLLHHRLLTLLLDDDDWLLTPQLLLQTADLANRLCQELEEKEGVVVVAAAQLLVVGDRCRGLLELDAHVVHSLEHLLHLRVQVRHLFLMDGL